MKMKKMRRLGGKALAVLLAAALLLGAIPLAASAASYTSSATLTFSAADINETSAGSGYAISGTALTISSSGTYTITGSCSDGSITVKKSVTAVLILDNLTLTGVTTAPLVCAKSSDVTVYAVGSSTLTDGETDDTSDDYEGAAIKVKSGGSLTLEGDSDSTLTLAGSSKNGIKGAATSTVTVNTDGALNITAENHGLAADGSVVIKKGTISITAGNEGIKSSPDEDDADSAGTIAISGGDITIDTVTNGGGDGIQAENGVTISGGTFNISAYCDGIQSNADLTITDGDFTIKTLSGYKSSSFNSSTMSCKGLKASAADADEEDEDATNVIKISGGSFSLNTADDAVHSDGSVYLTGGTFDIYTGDDAVHADSYLEVGGALTRDPTITVNYCYEGLEAGTVQINGGRVSVYATDDGINAAGGSTSGSDPSAGGADHFKPGGGPGGGFGGGPGGNTGGGSGGSSSSSSDYELNIAGGIIYVYADGDGLDSNGSLTLTGGRVEIWAQYNADNEPLDCDGTLTVKGATVFAAGSQGMGYPSPSNSQTYKNYTKLSITSGKVVSVKNGSTTVFATKAPKSADFFFYSSPSMSSSYTSSVASGTLTCSSAGACSDWVHTWDSGEVTTPATETSTGVKTFTCSVCGLTEEQTIPMAAEADEDDEEDEDKGWNVSITTDENSTVTVYTTQTVDDTGTVEATIAANGNGTVVSRDGDSGDPDNTGNGQVNFVITTTKDYVPSVAITGTYKNLKLVSSDTTDTEADTYVYRITKIESDLTVAVTAEEDSTEDTTGALAVTFDVPENCTVYVYNTQEVNTTGANADITITKDNGAVDSSGNAATVYARNTSGVLDNTGSGQVNFVVVPATGYEATVAATGTYKNLKQDPDGNGNDTVYRITKITSAVAVTVSVASSVTVTGIIVHAPTKTSYYVGDELDLTGLTVAVTYSDTTTKNIEYTADSGITYSGYDSSLVGNQTITVAYGGLTGTFQVTVSALSVTAIAISSKPTTTSYTVGDALDPTGLALTVTYNSTATATVSYTTANADDFDFDPEALSTAGTQEITVTYGGQTATFTVAVSEAAATYHTVTFRASHATVDVYYTAAATAADEANASTAITRDTTSGAASADGSVIFTVTPDASYTVESVTAGEDTLTAASGKYTLSGLTADTTVTVNTTAVESAVPTVTFVSDGHCVVNVFYTTNYDRDPQERDRGDTKARDTRGEMDPSGNGTVNFQVVTEEGYDVASIVITDGTAEVTSYFGMKGPSDTGADNVYRITKITGDITVNVTTKAVESIAITTLPTKTRYTVGQKLEPSGLAATVTYSDGTSTVVNYNNNTSHFTFDPETLSTAGTQEITVTYGGKTATFEVTVSAAATGGGTAGGGAAEEEDEDEILVIVTESGVTASATENSDGTITVTAQDAAGNALASVAGGVKVVIPDVEDGQVVVIVNADGTETVVKKSLVEDDVAYVLLDGSATIRVEDNGKAYSDVSAAAWYGDAVDFVTSHELFYGVSDTQFAPAQPMTRSMLVAVLYRLEDEPEAAVSETFRDVKDGAWYTEAVQWASETAIVAGYDNGLFGVSDSVTREQLVTILYRYAKRQGLAGAAADLTAYADSASVSSWASEAMAWAVGSGIVSGRTATTLAPKDTASRAEVASMMLRLVGYMVK